MCEYCHGLFDEEFDSPGLHTDIRRIPIGLTKVRIGQDISLVRPYENQSRLVASVYDWESGEDIFRSMAIIKYCPMCGTKLPSKES